MKFHGKTLIKLRDRALDIMENAHPTTRRGAVTLRSLKREYRRIERHSWNALVKKGAFH